MRKGALHASVFSLRKIIFVVTILIFNRRGQHKRDANGNWHWIPSPNQVNPYDGYMHSVTNTYGMTDQGLWNLAETMNLVKKVLIERILEKV